jgi:segregation and condensation protein A
LEVIVRFLALLEIYKQGFIELGQGERFGDIEVVWTGGSDSSAAPAFAIDDYDG